MALQQQALNINFAQGLDTKADPKQISPGRFLALENTVFTKEKLLMKRNGYGPLSPLPDDDSTFITTFKGNLTAVSDHLNAYNSGSDSWSDKGLLQPAELDTLSLLRTNTNQSQADAVVSANDLVCMVYTDEVPVNGVIVNRYKYLVADATTGQNVIPATLIVPTAGAVSGSPKAFLLGRYFVIVFPVTITSVEHLQYIAINTADPTTAIAAVDITSEYESSDACAWDGFVVNNSLYLAYNGSDMGGAVHINYLTSTLSLSAAVDYPAEVATHVSVSADSANQNVYVSYYDSASSDGFTLILNAQLQEVLAPTQTINSEDVVALTSSAISGVGHLFYEIENNYTYDSAIRTDYIKKNTITQAGVLGTAATVARSVGLASKSFIVNNSVYMLSIYGAPAGDYSTQPTYFLMDDSGDVIAKLAYSNGGSYNTLGLPNVTVSDNLASFAYLIKDQLSSVNKSQGATNTAGIYSQTGVNLAKITIGGAVTSAEIGNNLNLSGGILWAYDGYQPVEQGFHLWPDSVEASLIADPVTTGDTTDTSNVITDLASLTNVVVGMKVAGTGIPANTYVTALLTATSIQISNNATATGNNVTLTFTGAVTAQQYYYQVTYEWSDNQGNIFRSAPSIPITVTASAGHTAIKLNIPTLRLTYKINNAVKIVVYRWSVAQQTYYQVTSAIFPLLNVPTSDSVTFTDILPDSSIIGNTIIYTTGGVVENIGAPACRAASLFKSRLFLIDAENEDLLWFSKQVIPGTPVEMSDLLTYNVAPSLGAQGSTGPNRCLAPLDDKNIIFKDNAIYYFTGNGPDNTGANNDFSEPVFITATVGCDNQASIVFIPSGLMFQSDKGIWLLGRDLSTKYIGAPVEEFTTDARVLSAINVPGTNQVRFTLDSGVTLMYDYFYDQWGSFTNIPAISNTVYNGLDTYINDSGQVFQETPGEYLDGNRPVLIRFRTGWLNLAGIQGYQRAYEFFLLAEYISPHKLVVQIAYDYNESPSQSSVISPDNFAKAYGDEQLWGSGPGWGGNDNSPEQWRVFLERQKCQAFQITIQEIFDPSFGVPAGAGLTMSGLTLNVGLKKGSPKLKASRATG